MRQEISYTNLRQTENDTKIIVALIKKLHRSWLGSLYEFAGPIRTVDLTKGSVTFAPIAFMEGTLLELDKVLAEKLPVTKCLKTESP